MNAEQYDQWKNDPLTVLFHQFLTDYRLSLMEQWADGALTDPDSRLVAMGRCQLAKDLVELGDDWISDFYKSMKGNDHVPEDQGTGG